MKKLKVCAALVLAVLMLALTTGCGAGNLLVGTWKNTSETVTIDFYKDGTATVTAYDFPLPARYTLSGDTLTVTYGDESDGDDIFDTGVITFFGDDEFCWEQVMQDGETFQEYYAREQ